MRFAGLLFLFSLNAFSGEFKSFNFYKQNKTQLVSDIERLESLMIKKNSQDTRKLYETTISQYRLVFDNIERLNAPMNFKLFTSEASEKAQDIVDICEGQVINYSKCITELNAFKLSIADSKFRHEVKDLLKVYIDNYIFDKINLSLFNEEFISSFNANTNLVNKILLPSITIKVTPVKKLLSHGKAVQPHSIKSIKMHWGYASFLFSALCVMGSFLFYKRKNKFNNIKDFYKRIFLTAKKNKIKLKLFGVLDFSSLSVINKIEGPLLESIQCFQVFATEADVKFRTNKNALSCEFFFFSKTSFLDFFEKHSTHKEKIENLQQAVDACGGELIFSNHFNTQGLILHSNIIINLPLSQLRLST